MPAVAKLEVPLLLLVYLIVTLMIVSFMQPFILAFLYDKFLVSSLITFMVM